MKPHVRINLSLGGLATIVEQVRADQQMKNPQAVVLELLRDSLRAKGYLPVLKTPKAGQ